MFALILGGWSAAAQTMLIYHDDDAYLAGEAGLAAGFLVEAHFIDGPAFEAAYRSAPWDVVVVESPSLALPAEVITVVRERAAASEPMLFSWWDLDSDPALAGSLGVATASYTAPLAHRAAAGAPDLFAEIGGVLDGHTADAGDNGDYLTPTFTGRIVAVDDTGGGTIALTRDGTTFVNGLLPFDFGGTDGDADGVLDMVEVYLAELERLPPPLVLTLDGACPGLVSVSIDGLTPGGDAAIVRGTPGPGSLPAGPCTDAPVDLADPEFGLIRVVTADADGGFRIRPTVPAPMCGVAVQVVDLETCRRTRFGTL